MRMSRLWILFTTTSILFSTATLSTPNRYMTHYDLTRDGKVDSRELRTVAYMDHKLPPAISDDIFRKADRSGDKFIDHTEIIAAVRLIRRHVAQATSRWLEDHDMDGDSRMNEMELFESVYMEHGLSTTDVNDCFRESDVDKDKHLTSNELVEALHCSRLLALKEAKELLKIYDTDGDHRLNIREAQMLASLRYDIKPGYAAIVFEDVSHRADHTINELELVDFLTKLREKAAVAALNKLSGLDRNGDEVVSFSELLQGYEKQLKKSVLKKIFSNVDVNKNAHIDPIEFVSLQNFIADEIHLQTIQNDSEERYFTTTDATTSLPTLVIFGSSKKSHNQQSRRQRKRRSDLEIDKKLVVNDDSQPGIKELTATNASSIYFSTAVTAVPKFMKSNNDYQKFISNGAKMISEMLADSKRRKNKEDRIETDDIKKTWDNSFPNDNGSPLIQGMMQRDDKLASAINEGRLKTDSTSDKNGHTGDQNEALSNNPNTVYMKKFEKFFDFLQKTIKKITKAVKENNEKQAGILKSPLKGINITKHLNRIADNNTSNNQENEIQKMANVSEISIFIPTTNKKSKMKGSRDDVTYRKSRNEENLIVHTPIDSSEYETVPPKKFSGLFDTPFLQLDEEKIKKEVKMINFKENSREGPEHSSEEKNFHDEEKVEEDSEIVDEDECTLENQTNSSDSDKHQNQTKKYKCNIRARKSNETTSIRSLQKVPGEFEKGKSNVGSKNQDKRKRKLQNKSLSKAGSLEHETILSLLRDVENENSLLEIKNKSSSVSHKVYSENDNDESTEMIPEAEGDEESSELFNEKGSTKYINSNESSEQESGNKYNSTVQLFGSQRLLNEKSINLTDKYDRAIYSGRDSTGLKKTFTKAKENRLSSHKAMHLEEDKSVSESGLPVHILVDEHSKNDKFLKANSMFSTENITNEYSQTTDFQLLKSHNSSSEQTQLQIINNKNQEMPNSNMEDELFDQVLSDILNATLYEIDQTSITERSENQSNMVSQKNKKLLLKLKKKDAVPQFLKTSVTSLPKMSIISVTPPSTSKISPSTTINSKLSTMMSQPNEAIDEQNSAEVRLIEKKRNECSPERKCPAEDDISAGITIPTPNTKDVTCDNKDLPYECRLKKRYQSKVCSNNQKCTSLNWSIETSESIDSPEQSFSQKTETESLHQNLKTNETNQPQVNEWRTERSEDLLLRAIQEYHEYLKSQKSKKKHGRISLWEEECEKSSTTCEENMMCHLKFAKFFSLDNSPLLMSNKHEITTLRPSLKKQTMQAQARARDSDAKRHVTFVTPKLPPYKCNLPKQQPTSDQLDSKFRKQKSVVDVHRKRIPSVQLAELHTKKNKHNEQIVRLCEAQKALVKSDFVIRRMEKEAKEQERAATMLLQNAVSLIETDVLRSFEKQRIEDLLDSAEQQQYRTAQELHREIAGYNERIADIEKAMVAIEKYNEMLDMQFTFEKSNGSLSVAEEMKLLSADINLYLDVLDSLKQFHL